MTQATLENLTEKTQAITPAKGPEMPFISHVAELRSRLLWCFTALSITSTAAFFYMAPFIKLLQSLAPKTVEFVQLTPGEVFVASFKLSIIVGFGLALPVMLYHLLRFASPALENKEKRMIFPLLATGIVLFGAGVVFAYYAVLPFMLDFLLGYGQEVAKNQLSIASYLDFCTIFLLASGLMFQLPMVLLFMAFINLVNSRQLLAQWKWAIIVSFIVGAVITPSADPFSQTFMAIALLGLYLISIVMMKAFGK